MKIVEVVGWTAHVSDVDDIVVFLGVSLGKLPGAGNQCKFLQAHCRRENKTTSRAAA